MTELRQTNLLDFGYLFFEHVYCINEFLHSPKRNPILPFMFFITQCDGPFPYEGIK